MKIPFTIEQFLEVFKNYNQSIYPLQFVFYLLAAIAIFMSLRKTRNSDKVIGGILAFFWVWMGVAYHSIYFSTVNPAAYIFGAGFTLQGILFLYFSIFKPILTFQFSPDLYGIAGSILIVFALILYPLIGYSQGHIYPASPTFGLPCPTTIFTFGVLLWTNIKFPFTLIIIPIIWSVIGFSAAFTLGIKEDTGLLIAGIIFILLVTFRLRLQQ